MRSEDRLEFDVIAIHESIRRFAVRPSARLTRGAGRRVGRHLSGELHQPHIASVIAQLTGTKLLLSPTLHIQRDAFHRRSNCFSAPPNTAVRPHRSMTPGISLEPAAPRAPLIPTNANARSPCFPTPLRSHARKESVENAGKTEAQSRGRGTQSLPGGRRLPTRSFFSTTPSIRVAACRNRPLRRHPHEVCALLLLACIAVFACLVCSARKRPSASISACTAKGPKTAFIWPSSIWRPASSVRRDWRPRRSIRRFWRLIPAHKFLYAVSEVVTLRGKPTGGVVGLCRRPGDGQPHAAQRATLRGSRALLPDRRQIGKERPRRQLRRRHGRRAPHRRDGPPEAGLFRHRPSRQRTQSAAAGEGRTPIRSMSTRPTASPSRPIWERPHLRLSLRPGGRQAHAERSAGRRDRARLGPAALRLSSHGPLRLSHQRNGAAPSRPSGTTPRTAPSRPSKRSPRCPRVSKATTRRRRSSSIRRASTSTAPTAATTASPSSPSTPPPAASPRSATNRPKATPRATSRSTPPAPTSWPPTSTPTPSRSSASTRQRDV